MTADYMVETVFPTRGAPGGWRTVWDDPDDCAQLRARAEAANRRQTQQAARLGVIWQGEIREERRRRERRQS